MFLVCLQFTKINQYKVCESEGVLMWKSEDNFLGPWNPPPDEPYFLLPTVFTEQVARIITTIILFQFNCDFFDKMAGKMLQ